MSFQTASEKLPTKNAALLGQSEREIFRLIKNAEVHFVEPEGVFVCRNSIPVSKEQ
jgi:hypothetical protein